MIDYDTDMNQLWKEIEQDKLERKEIVENICAQRVAIAGVIGGLKSNVHILDVESTKGYVSRYMIETIMSLIQEDIQNLEQVIGWVYLKERE